jgi:hypothetical protein
LAGSIPNIDSSSILTSSYDKLSRVDARNDSQMIFYDQVVPGGSLFVTENAYPREALTEALLRFIEEDLATP